MPTPDEQVTKNRAAYDARRAACAGVPLGCWVDLEADQQEALIVVARERANRATRKPNAKAPRKRKPKSKPPVKVKACVMVSPVPAMVREPQVKAIQAVQASIVPPRRIDETPMWAILPVVRKYATKAERKSARAATQKRSQAKAKARADVVATARRDETREYQRGWVARKRAKAHAAKQARLDADHRADFRFWLACWVNTKLLSGWSLPIRRNLKSVGLGLPISVILERGY